MPRRPEIDLGTYRYDPEEGRPTGPQVAHRPERWRPRWSRWRRPVMHRWAPVAAGALVMAMAGASAADDPALAPLWSAPAVDDDGIPGLFLSALDDERIYLPTVDGGTSTLTAHRLVDGQVDWQVDVEPELAEQRQATVRMAGGTLVVITDSGTQPTVSGHDPATGEQRWSRSVQGYQVVGDRVLVHRQMPQPDGPDDHAQLAALDPEDGQERATIDLTLDSLARMRPWQAPDGASHLFVLSRDGEVTRHDMTGGGADDSVATPHAEREPDSVQNSVSLAGDVLLVGARGGEEPNMLSAHDPASLEHLWTFPGGSSAGECGDQVCVRVDPADEDTVGEVVHAVDPATGATRWTLPCAEQRAGPDCVAPSVHQLDPVDRLWVEEFQPSDAGAPAPAPERVTAWIADAATGEAVTGTTDWRFASQVSDSELLLARGEPVTGGALEQQQPTTRTWWARADLDLTEVEVLGVTEAHSCQSRHPYLICDTDGELTVWRFDP